MRSELERSGRLDGTLHVGGDESGNPLARFGASAEGDDESLESLLTSDVQESRNAASRCTQHCPHAKHPPRLLDVEKRPWTRDRSLRHP